MSPIITQRLAASGCTRFALQPPQDSRVLIRFCSERREFFVSAQQGESRITDRRARARATQIFTDTILHYYIQLTSRPYGCGWRPGGQPLREWIPLHWEPQLQQPRSHALAHALYYCDGACDNLFSGEEGTLIQREDGSVLGLRPVSDCCGRTL